MFRLVRHILVLCAIFFAVVVASAQELVTGVDFDALFDNKEYSSMKFDESGTLFSARLTPKVGINWAERNELMFAVDMVQDFGHNSKFLSDVNVQMYYAYRAPRVTAMIGIFNRSEMRGLQSSLFFDRTYRYYHNTMSGVLARYQSIKSPTSYVEFGFDMTGMRAYDVRETFMIMSSGRHAIKWFNFGYDLMVGHYAKDYNPDTDDGVVDNILAVPYVGCDIEVGGFDIDVRISYVQSLQRDRHFEDVWCAPAGGELYAGISRWGVTLSNRVYCGKGLLTYFNRYGADLYHGSPLYATTELWYEAVELSYNRRFFDDTLSLKAGITMEYDGVGWGTRQWIEVGVDLDYRVSLKRKQQYIE